MRRRGSTIHLEDYSGTVRIQNCSFSNTTSPVNSIFNVSAIQEQPPTDSQTTLHSSSYGLRIDSVVSVANSQGDIYLLENIFTHNYGTKGPVYLSARTEAFSSTIVAIKNNFTSNTGYFGSASMYVKSVSETGRCGGVFLSNNTFQLNSLLSGPGGILTLACYHRVLA